MKLLIRAQLYPAPVNSEGEKVKELVSVASKIKNMIQKHPEDTFDFVIGDLEEDPKKAKKAKYKDQKRVNTKNLKGEKFKLELKGGDVVVSVNDKGYAKIESVNEDASVPVFSDFLNEKSENNIKKTFIYGHSAKVYCLGKDLKIHCKNSSEADQMSKKFKKHYHSVYLDDNIVEISLLPSEILKFFLEKHE